MAYKSKVTVDPKLKANLAKVEKHYNILLQKGLMQAGYKLLALTDPFVPVETGDLKRSGYVALDKKDGKPVVRVGYSIDYAVYVHEDLDKAHGEAYNVKYASDIAAGTKMAKGPLETAKFLSKAAQENKQVLLDIIKESTKQAIPT